MYESDLRLALRLWALPAPWHVDPKVSSVFITCYNNHNSFGEEYFEMHDGGQFIPDRFKLKTSSIETIIEYLVKFGINNKASIYNDK